MAEELPEPLAAQICKDLEHREMGYSFEPAHRAWITQERRPNDADAPGHLGDPRHASAEKQEELFACHADGVEPFLKKVTAWDGHSWKWLAREPRALFPGTQQAAPGTPAHPPRSRFFCVGGPSR